MNMGKKLLFSVFGDVANWCSHSGNQLRKLSKTNHISSISHLYIILSICLHNSKSYSTIKFLIALLTIVMECIKLNIFQSTNGQWRTQMWFIYTIKLYFSVKNEIIKFSGTWKYQDRIKFKKFKKKYKN